jgi:RNA polymerase sigma-70 factor (ECF subfamily)
MPTDEELMERVRDERDEGAFEELKRRHWLRTKYICFLVLQRHGDDEDANQDVWVIVWARADRFSSGRNFGNWVTAVARNRAIDWSRKIRPTEQYDDALDQRVQTDEDMVIQVNDVLNMLPEENSRILRWKYYHGRSIREIAAILETSEPTASLRLKLARERFRAFWEEGGREWSEEFDDPDDGP